MKLAFLLLPFLALAQDPPAKASLEGHVVNAVGGEPLRKVRLTMRMNVAANRQGAPQPVVSTSTDTAGKFLFENLDPGDYQLTARRDGFAAYTMGALTEGKKREPVVLGAGDRKSGLVLKLTPFGVISGRVVDEDGDPVQGVPVSAMQWEYTSRGRELAEGRSTSTDDRGEYRLYDVPAGRYLLKFAHRGLRLSRSEDAEYFVASYFPGAADASNAAPFDIKPGQQLTGVAITLRKARLATLRGRVIAPPEVRVSVGLMITSDRGTSSTSNSIDDKDHKFELAGLSPGPYVVTAQYALNGQNFNALLPVEVGTSDIGGLELRPSPPLEVPGTVRIEGASTQKLSLLRAVAYTPGRSVLESVKDDGTFLLRGLMPNVYRVGINPVPLLYTKSIHWGTADITEGQLDLTAGVPPRTEVSIVMAADVGQVDGTVMNDKEPAEGAVVTLIRNDGRKIASYFRSATVDAAGRFSIKGIAPGGYRLIAWDKVNVNAVQYDPDFLRPYETAGERVTVEPNDKKSIELKVTTNLSPAP
jgi:hypothetical protein